MALPISTPPVTTAPLDAAQRYDLALRPFMRVTAEVLSVSGVRAVLSIDGHPVVAQITSPEQAAALRTQHLAHFVVSQVTEDAVVLKFLNGGPDLTAATGANAGRSELANHLLEQMNLPATQANLTLARALLNQRLPVTPELFQELTNLLQQSGAWGDQEANLAAAMKAAGLPLTPGALQLFAAQPGALGQELSALQGNLTALLGQNIPAPLRAVLESALGLLDQTRVDAQSSPQAMAERLRQAVTLLGRSLEHMLGEQVRGGSALWPEESLLTLARLQTLLREAGQDDAASDVHRFLDLIRQQQLLNVRADPASTKADWVGVNFTLHGGEAGQETTNLTARLRISRRGGARKGAIDPQFTNLVVQVDLEDGRALQADLALTGKTIRTNVTAPDEALAQEARASLNELRASLERLGYAVGSASVGVGSPEPVGELVVDQKGHNPMQSVDLEV
ncbi:MAG: flagellar hook-length control protein FliK [Anaerolineae bacterium]|nr:flagellar hook-length control protein FliK [Anaerolineae bacterium]